MVCDCGSLFEILHNNARNRGSSGCKECSKIPAIRAKKKHGLSKHPLYKTYRAMLSRCTNKKAPNYSDYGGRGITVCKRWLDSFEKFLADVGERPEDHTLDRINNNMGYEPTNVRWATQQTQCRNTRANRRIFKDGLELSIVEWSEITGIPRNTISCRLRNGWVKKELLLTLLIFSIEDKKR